MEFGMQPIVTDEQRAAMDEIAAIRARMTPEQKAAMSAKSYELARTSYRGPNYLVSAAQRLQQAEHEVMLAEYDITPAQAI